MTIEPAEPAVLPDTASLTSSETEDAKEELRAILRSHRRSRHRHGEHGHNAVCRAFTDHALQALDGARAVAAYVSVGHEPCTRQLLDRLAERDIAVLLPVLGPHLARSWGDFHGARDLAERAPGRPPEPGGDDILIWTLDPRAAERLADLRRDGGDDLTDSVLDWLCARAGSPLLKHILASGGLSAAIPLGIAFQHVLRAPTEEDREALGAAYRLEGKHLPDAYRNTLLPCATGPRSDEVKAYAALADHDDAYRWALSQEEQ